METDSEKAIAASTLHSTEFKLLQAYCCRRQQSNRPKVCFESPVVLKGQSGFKSELRRMTAQNSRPTKSTENITVRAQGLPVDELDSVANKLTKIADNVDLTDDPGTDTSDDIIQRLVELLRATGDQLDGELKKNPALVKQLQASLSYSFFEKVTKTFLDCVVPSWPGRTQCTQEARIAMTCEVTSRLSALDLQPMNRIMGFGAQFLQQNFSSWVQQYGGWEKAFDKQEDEDEVH